MDVKLSPSFLTRRRLLSTGAAGLCLPAVVRAESSRHVQDMFGTDVAVPDAPLRIADLWFAHNEIVTMLGAGSRIRVTVDGPDEFPWLYRIASGLKDAHLVHPAGLNPEMLIAAGIQLAFTSTEQQALPLRAAGIPTMAMAFQDMSGLLKSLAITADVINTPLARDRAASWTSELKQLSTLLNARLASVPMEKRPRVLHLIRLSPVAFDGGHSIIGEWITQAGGINVAAAVSGTKRTTTIEQVAAWDPDIIIVQGGVTLPPEGAAPPGWEMLRAVKEGRVISNPFGMFPWDRYGTEFLLQLRWAARMFHPDLFSDIDLRSETSRFYRTFFDCSLSGDEVSQILSGHLPS
ncbi:ABC transporter substrate-binding protein [Acetobacter sp. AN02]|uniref:ABC transporter substrate-binding protein n=1 Tax=Acetobacter sp. AN02 TaxID=2894186 RepID=UPI0024342F1C|nr:ABC transporter substrate-binding protein [Acetobacter sp. AN02]MDG6094806.1 ABC transporter substrate-binding protein [Acetobacter sp. AN02]